MMNLRVSMHSAVTFLIMRYNIAQNSEESHNCLPGIITLSILAN